MSVLVTPGLGSTCCSEDVVLGMVSMNISGVKRPVGESPAVLETMQVARGSPSQPGTHRAVGHQDREGVPGAQSLFVGVRES